MTEGWLPCPDTPYPISPKNVQVVTNYHQQTLDIRWDDPAINHFNSSYILVGCNVYRSDDTEYGPYRRINKFPIGSPFFRDSKNNALVSEEIVPWDSAWVYRGDGPNDYTYMFRTQQVPLVDPEGTGLEPTNFAQHVEVKIDGVVVPVRSVVGARGEVELVLYTQVDVPTEKYVNYPIPTQDSVVTVSYHTSSKNLRMDLDKRSWYRVTTVAIDGSSESGLIETPLEYSEPHSLIEVETLDYVWREAVRRNNWILEQGGERVKLFIRRTTGIPCYCKQDEKLRSYTKMPYSKCGVCFGTGFIGGYSGPYEAIIGPDDAERRISQADIGRRKEHTYEVWIGPYPVLTQRDFLVKQTNERYSVGPVRRPSNRGNLLQQHFNIAYLDEADIRYKMPICGVTELPWPQCRVSGQLYYHALYTGQQNVPFPVQESNVSFPMETEKDNIPDERELRGRTATWENWTY